MNKMLNIVQYWAGYPIGPDSKWQRFVRTAQLCRERGWRPFLVWSKIPEDPMLSQAFDDIGCEIIIHPRPSRNFDGRCIHDCYRLLKRVECNVFHCYNVHTSPLIAAAMAKIPVRLWSLFSMSPYYEKGIKPRGIHRLSPSVRVSGRLSHRILAISTAVRDELVTQGVCPEKISVVPTPIDLARFTDVQAGDVRQRLNLAESDIIITTVGHAVPVKGWDVLLDAFVKVQRTIPRAHLVFVGGIDAPEEQELAERLNTFVCREDITAKVHFLGKRGDIPEILKASNIFVLPSRSEGQSSALTEAMASGLPCVASRTGGNIDMIVHGETGLLFEREDATGLAECLITVAKDQNLAKQVAENGRKFARQYGMDEMTTKMLDLYETLHQEALQGLARKNQRDSPLS